MARDGFLEDDIIKKLGITKRKYSSLVKSVDGLKDELEYAKLLVDYKVEDALLKKALGTTQTETKETVKPSGSESVTITKEIPSDTSALQFWLKNRCPERWTDKSGEIHSVDEKLTKIFNEISQKAQAQHTKKAYGEDNAV